MVDIQLQIQNIIKLTNIETILLQIREICKTQIGKDIDSIFEELRNIIYGDIEQQTYHIQVLLADKLN